MKMIILFLCFINQIVFSQTLKPELINKLIIETDNFIGFDALGDFYYTKENVFLKKTKLQLLEYKNLSLGKIYKIDIQNPLKIVLFYQDFNTIITLDNQLNETQKINFSDFENPINVSATGISSNNKLWVFNSFDNKIGLFNYLKKDYKSISVPISYSIKNYNSDFNNFYFIDENNKFYYCDIYGRILFLMKIPDFDQVSIINSGQIIYSKNNNLFLFDLKNNQNQKIEISEKTIENFCYKNQILTIFTIQEISNYKINLE